MALALVADPAADLFFEWFDEIEGDVGGLEAFEIGASDVVDQRTEGGAAGYGL